MPLPHAKVPILKWTDAATGVHVDACVNRVDALRTSALLARSAATLPALRPLCLVLLRNCTGNPIVLRSCAGRPRLVHIAAQLCRKT